MNRRKGRLMLAVAFATAAAALAACGGGSHGRNRKSSAVARVGGVPITRAVVGHWISALAGTDFYELSGGHTVPTGLISDPPNYQRCVATLQSAEKATSARGTDRTGTPLRTKCRQLYQSIKTQAIAFLVSAQWAISSDRDLGITASNSEVLRLFEQTKGKLYGSNTALQRFLSTRHLSFADLLLQTRLNLLGRKTVQRVGSTGDHRALAAEFNETWARWDRRTSCNEGEIVQHCKQYRGGDTYPLSPPASVMVEQMAAIVDGGVRGAPAAPVGNAPKTTASGTTTGATTRER